MNYEDYIKYGKKVRRTWREYDFYAATAKGYGSIPYDTKQEIVTICGTMRERETKRFASVRNLNSYFTYAEDYEILVTNEKGVKFYANIEELSPYAEISDLTFDELKELRKQICVGSIYLSDYANSFGVDTEYLSSLCEDYLSYLCDEYGEDGADAHDTSEEFALFATA